MECVNYKQISQNKLDDFFEKAFKACGFLYEPDTLHKDLRNIEAVYENTGGGFWCLFQNDLVIGTAGLKVSDRSEKIGELKCMYLLPDFQGKGLGQLLIDKIFLESKNRQFKKIRLDVKTQSSKAISLYRKNGFYKIPRYNDNKNDVLFMGKLLEANMNFKIHPYKIGQEFKINKLIRRVYDEFVAPDYTGKGNEFFYDWILPEKIADRQRKHVNLFTAAIDSEFVGMIEIRENKNISLLFVDKAYHGKGIAKGLFKTALEECLAKDDSLAKFYVHASPYSIPVYERLGFKKSGEMHEEYGIKYLPMEMNL